MEVEYVTLEILEPWRHESNNKFNSWYSAGQRRTMFIQTQSTPNPSSLMFYPGKPVMEVGSADFPNARSAMNSPLAKALYGVDGKLCYQCICVSHCLIN